MKPFEGFSGLEKFSVEESRFGVFTNISDAKELGQKRRLLE